MRDIRFELRERLAAAADRLSQSQVMYESERSLLEARYRSEMAELDREISALRTLIEIEAKRGEEPQPLPPELTQPGLPLADFFITTLHSRGPLSKDELRTAAERAGYFHDGESSGRATHTTLMNIVRAKKIVEIEDGQYAYPSYPRIGDQSPASYFFEETDDA